MPQTLLAILLIGHAISHAGLTSAPNPSDPELSPGAFFLLAVGLWIFDHPANQIISSMLMLLWIALRKLFQSWQNRGLAV